MDVSSVTKPVSTVVVTNLLMASPAFAAGKLFDFGLTLPIMAGQFLLLMVFLDKTWFTPVGKVLDERDELIRSKLASVQGDSSKLAQMQEEAEAILREARNAATAAVNEARTTTQAEQDAKLEALRVVRHRSSQIFCVSASKLCGCDKCELNLKSESTRSYACAATGPGACQLRQGA